MEPLKYKVSMDDIAAIIKKRSVLVLCGDGKSKPTIEISYDDSYGDRPGDGEEAGEALRAAMEDW